MVLRYQGEKSQGNTWGGNNLFDKIRNEITKKHKLYAEKSFEKARTVNVPRKMAKNIRNIVKRFSEATTGESYKEERLNKGSQPIRGGGVKMGLTVARCYLRVLGRSSHIPAQ